MAGAGGDLFGDRFRACPSRAAPGASGQRLRRQGAPGRARGGVEAVGKWQLAQGGSCLCHAFQPAGAGQLPLILLKVASGKS